MQGFPSLTPRAERGFVTFFTKSPEPLPERAAATGFAEHKRIGGVPSKIGTHTCGGLRAHMRPSEAMRSGYEPVRCDGLVGLLVAGSSTQTRPFDRINTA